MTMHSSKGLEYDTVIILDINEGNIPKMRQGIKLDRKELEEERRIFYVAMTRAKKALILSYVTGTKDRPKLPSCFIEPLL